MNRNHSQMTSSASVNRPLHLFAIGTTVFTLLLICSGGLVTSKGVGMSVPDWPTTYGYNMFLFPISRWVGGVLYEHTHRLIASGVGLCTLLLTAWILAVEKRRWVRILGIVAFLGVVFQGVLGGLRVTLNANSIGIFHGMIAQSFLSILGILAVVTSSSFLSGRYAALRAPRGLKWVAMMVTLIIFVQLMVAASMRHAHAGLSIPDFPTAYGRWWPPVDAISVAQINHHRAAQSQVATSAAQIVLQMIHRMIAVLILIGVALFAWISRRTRPINRWGLIWLFLIGAQIVLGIWTIWSNKAADIATTHMTIGAISLFLGVQLTFRLFCASRNEKFQTLAGVPARGVLEMHS